jgi:hypothetical protein
MIAVIPDHKMFFSRVIFITQKRNKGRNGNEIIFSKWPALILEDIYVPLA